MYYDPADPRRSVLEREPPRSFITGWLFVLAAAIVGGVAYFTR